MRKILLVAALAVSAAAVNAQATFGVKAGANFSSIKSSGEGEDDNSDMKVGLNIGALANVPISEMFSFQPEVVFSMEGGKEEEDDIKVTLKLNYINVPLLLQYNASGFIAETGPQIGFLMSAKGKVEGLGEEVEEDIKEEYEGINLSWAIGLGYKMPSGFGVNARYNLGLSNIDKDDSEGDFKTKTNTIQVGVFYTFGGGASARK
jgi:hypothetical protein